MRQAEREDMEHVSDTLQEMRDELYKARDNEVSMCSEIGVQYITDHHDTEAYKEVERQANQLARAWDRMIARLDKWTEEARKIEVSCENFYGD
jgi:translation initiation factor 2B subunit (eIF-2B alpha/beta/delta family)